MSLSVTTVAGWGQAINIYGRETRDMEGRLRVFRFQSWPVFLVLSAAASCLYCSHIN